jgi:hypothetical protein
MKIILIKDTRTKILYFEIIGIARKKTRWPKVKELYLYEPFTQKYRWQKVIINIVKQDKKYFYVEVAKMKEEE